MLKLASLQQIITLYNNLIFCTWIFIFITYNIMLTLISKKKTYKGTTYILYNIQYSKGVAKTNK